MIGSAIQGIVGFVCMVLFSSTALAQNRLCDTRFLEGATGAEVQRLVSQGADADGLCNQLENRPCIKHYYLVLRFLLM